MPFAFEAGALDALLLTHAHLDHCGRIPALVQGGLPRTDLRHRGTADLTEIVLRDAAKLQEEAESPLAPQASRARRPPRDAELRARRPRRGRRRTMPAERLRAGAGRRA